MNVLSLFDGKYEVSDTGEVFSNIGKRKMQYTNKELSILFGMSSTYVSAILNHKRWAL